MLLSVVQQMRHNSRADRELLDFNNIRPDWLQGGDLVARAIQRHIRGKSSVSFANFPVQWAPLFEWIEADWSGVTPATSYVPLVSVLDEQEIRLEIEEARNSGQLRLLVETLASADVVLCETLQRVDVLRSSLPSVKSDETIRLTNWHSYSRPEIRSFEQDLMDYTVATDTVVFLSCGRSRPYDLSPTYKKTVRLLEDNAIDVKTAEFVVITSIGPVPQPLWNHDTVLTYDTAVRDIYRMLVLLRRLLHGSKVSEAYDCLSFGPYRDLLNIVHREGYLRTLTRLPGLRSRNIPNYRLKNAPK